MHGLGEHSGRYRHVAEHLLGSGCAVYAADHRGHGKSPGLRVHVDRFDDFVADVRAVRERAARDRPGCPQFLLGHSQGGLVALRSTLLEPNGLTGTIVSSPLLGIAAGSRPNALLRAAARLLSVVLPKLRLANKVDSRLLSRDPAVGLAYDRDPLVSHKVSARWYVELLAAMADTHRRAASLSVPTLLLAAGADAIVDPQASAAWAASAPAAMAEWVELAGFYHELLNEPEAARVLDAVDAWLAGRLVQAAR